MSTVLNDVLSVSMTLSSDNTTVLEWKDDKIHSPHKKATWYLPLSPAPVSSWWLKARAALSCLCIFWGTLTCLFSSSLRLNYHCKEEGKYFCLKDFNAECNFSSFLLGVHLACSLGLTDFLVSCSDLLLYWGDLCTGRKRGFGQCWSRTESTWFTEDESKPSFSSDSRYETKTYLCTAVSVLILEILKCEMLSSWRQEHFFT